MKALEDAFGTPADGARPLLRAAAHVRTATGRWIGAALGGYHDGENALADQLEATFRAGKAARHRMRWPSPPHLEGHAGQTRLLTSNQGDRPGGTTGLLVPQSRYRSSKLVIQRAIRVR